MNKWIQHPHKPPIPSHFPRDPCHRGGFWGGGGRVCTFHLKASYCTLRLVVRINLEQ